MAESFKIEIISLKDRDHAALFDMTATVLGGTPAGRVVAQAYDKGLHYHIYDIVLGGLPINLSGRSNAERVLTLICQREIAKDAARAAVNVAWMGLLDRLRGLTGGQQLDAAHVRRVMAVSDTEQRQMVKLLVVQAEHGGFRLPDDVLRAIEEGAEA